MISTGTGRDQKASEGRLFEDFSIGQKLIHPWPRTVGEGDAAAYLALTGHRSPLAGNAEAARRCGFPDAPLEPLLVFHIVFGLSVPDISLNAVANLGYADIRFLKPVYGGDTLSARSEVIGLKINSDGRSGVVTVRTEGINQRGETVLTLARWVMVPLRKSATEYGRPDAMQPVLPDTLSAEALADAVPQDLDPRGFDVAWTGERYRLGDYRAGERIDHIFGTTIGESEHMMAVRLYQNSARVHVDSALAAGTRFGRRVVYGGHVMSIGMALSRNGLANVLWLAGIEGGRHTAPVFADDTVWAVTEVLEVLDLPGRSGLGLVRLRLTVAKRSAARDPATPVLELRYAAAIAR